ncbi:MAG TPA: P-loop NTPase, partial [Acidimicrobiia bacterium]|nr:P-loop NTPase [Acidimicrobiia bacterium]
MAAVEDIRRALEGVIEPLLNRTLGELGVVAGVDKPLLGRAKATLMIPVPNYPYRSVLTARIAMAWEDGVDVEMLVMDDEARTALMTRLRDGAGPRVGQSGSPTRVISVSSGKGGVGQSSVTTNLAIAL